MFGAYFLHRSYFEDLYDAAHPCANEAFPFDIARAKALLREAGGDYAVRLKNGKQHPVSRSRVDQLQRWIGVLP